MLDKVGSLVEKVLHALLAWLKPAVRTRVIKFACADTTERKVLGYQENRVGLLMEFVKNSASPTRVSVKLLNDREERNRHSFRLINDGDTYTSDPVGREHRGPVFLQSDFADADAYVCITVFERE